MKTPLPFQYIGADFLFNIKRGILADEMGVGKTLQGVLAALKAKQDNLIICPANLKINWAREIIDQDPDAQIYIADSGTNIYSYATGDGSKWIIINYDLLASYSKERVQAILPYNTLIIDEAHNIKESDRIRTKATLELGEGIENIYLITGTPILNRPEELFTLLKIIGHPIADNWYSYAYRFCGAYKAEIKKRVYNRNTHKYELEIRRYFDTKGATNLDQLHRILKSVCLRRTKKQVLPNLPRKLPPKIIKVEMEEPYLTKYKNAWENYISYIERIKYELIQELGSEAQYNKKIKNLESSKQLVEIAKLRQITSAAKIKKVTADAFREVQLGNKVVLFTSFTYGLEGLKRILKYNNIKLVTLSGATKASNRQKAEDDFQGDPNTKIFIGNIKAAGVGITLTKACKVFFLDSEWTPALNKQAEDRVHRYTQTQEVEIRYYVVPDTIDEDLILTHFKKNNIINAVLENKKQSNIEELGIIKEIQKRILIRAGLSTPLV